MRFHETPLVAASTTAMDTDIVNINQVTLFNKVEYPYVVPIEDLKHVHTYSRVPNNRPPPPPPFAPTPIIDFSVFFHPGHLYFNVPYY